MADKIDSLDSLEGVGRRRLSKRVREAMAESGRRNIEAYLDKQDLRGEELLKDVAAFREQVLSELGAHPSATRRALAETAIATYRSISLVSNQLAKKRPKDVLDLTERVSWLSNTLLRCLKMLNLDAKPRPRSLADLAVRNDAENVQIPKLNSTN